MNVPSVRYPRVLYPYIMMPKRHIVFVLILHYPYIRHIFYGKNISMKWIYMFSQWATHTLFFTFWATGCLALIWVYKILIWHYRCQYMCYNDIKILQFNTLYVDFSVRRMFWLFCSIPFNGSPLFTVRIIHSLPLRMSAVQVFFQDKMVATSQLVGSEQFPTVNQVFFSTCRYPGGKP